MVGAAPAPASDNSYTALRYCAAAPVHFSRFDLTVTSCSIWLLRSRNRSHCREGVHMEVRTMIRKLWIVKAAAIGVAIGFGMTAVALSRSEINSDVSSALTRFYAQSDNHRELARKASAI